MRFQHRLVFAATLLMALHVCAAPVELRGSTTVNSVLVTPYQADIEREAGVALSIRPSNSGAGLADLVGFACDIAMISAPFKDVADRLSKTGPTKGLVLSEDEFKVLNLGEAQVLFVVDAANPVKSLSKAQLVGLLSGEIKNWRDVGGNDQAVALVAEQATGAMRTEIVSKVLGGKDFPASTKVVEVATQAAGAVAATPGALGFISSATPAAQRGTVKVLASEVALKQTLIVVTNAKPSADTSKVLEAIKKVAASALAR